MLLHASSVARGAEAVLLLGPPGSGQVRPRAAPDRGRLAPGRGRPGARSAEGGDLARRAAAGAARACWRCAASASSAACRSRRRRRLRLAVRLVPPKRCRGCPRPRPGRHRRRRPCRTSALDAAPLRAREGGLALDAALGRAPAAGGRLRVTDERPAAAAAPGRAGHRPVRRRQGLDPAGAGGSRLRDGGQPAAAGRWRTWSARRGDAPPLAAGIDTRTRGFSPATVAAHPGAAAAAAGPRRDAGLCHGRGRDPAAPLHRNAAAPPAGAGRAARRPGGRRHRPRARAAGAAAGRGGPGGRHLRPAAAGAAAADRAAVPARKAPPACPSWCRPSPFRAACRGKPTWSSTCASCATRTTTRRCGRSPAGTRRWPPMSRPTRISPPSGRRLTGFLDPLLPRYVAEGKKYLTVALGCTGGRHRSVLVAERLTAHLRRSGWRADVTHRELSPGTGDAAFEAHRAERRDAPASEGSPAAERDEGREALSRIP